MHLPVLVGISPLYLSLNTVHPKHQDTGQLSPMPKRRRDQDEDDEENVQHDDDEDEHNEFSALKVEDLLPTITLDEFLQDFWGKKVYVGALTDEVSPRPPDVP